MGCLPHRIGSDIRLLMSMQKQYPSGEPASEEVRTDSDNPAQASPREVAERAYFYYLKDGSSAGRELEDWLQAEQDLMLGQHRTTFHGSHN